MRASRAIHALSLSVLLSSCSCDPERAQMPGGPIFGNDGGLDPDNPGGGRDGGGDSGHDIISNGTFLCSYDDEDIATLEANGALRELSSATNEAGFAVLHHAEDGALVIEAVQVAQPAQPTVRLVPAASAPGRALIASAQDEFAMAYMAGGALSLRLLEAGAETHALSDAVAEGDDGADLFDLIGSGDGYLAIYAEQAGDEIAVRVQAVDGSGAPDGDPASVALPEGTEPGHIAFAKLDEGYLLAFSEADPDADADTETRTRVMGLVLDDALEVSGEPILLSRTPSDRLAFSLDSRAGSAGVLYQGLEGGVRPTVKLQRVEADGAVEQDSLNIASAPLRAIDGSIAAFGQGYAVAYRAQMSLGAEKPSIRIAFVNQFGLVVHDAELAETTDEAGPTSVTSTSDGKLLVSWISVDGQTPVTRALQLDCPGALRLCGGEVE